MNDYTKPVYQMGDSGKEFRTVSGLCKHLMNKWNADEIGSIGSDHLLKVYRVEDEAAGVVSVRPRRDRRVCIAVYKVSPPKIGEPMVLTLVAFT